MNLEFILTTLHFGFDRSHKLPACGLTEFSTSWKLVATGWQFIFVVILANTSIAQTIGVAPPDVSKELTRAVAVEPKDAIATWKIKPGFKIELTAHEPQTKDPIAICFDENGRMFVCEMLDHPESREEKPHLGRVSMLEDKDGDGYFESQTVFADDLPWPTGLIWANGGLYVLATPDIWRFEDKNNDGRAELREKVFTGFGPGDNADALMNHPIWGQDNRIHLAAGLKGSGAIQCLKRPDLPAIELNDRDFWFDPISYEFGLEASGAQYGISFDNFGQKFGNLNSEHLRFWVYDERYGRRNAVYSLPSPVQSIAKDGGAPDVFRISPDEPWRIIRTRWRVGGIAKGPVEGGGHVSGFLVAASGTVVYRGDAYGDDYVNNTFVGDVGSQLVHRKVISEDGASYFGTRAKDEEDIEFAASRDTWMRPASLANAPDGCLYIVDMYREVIEIPWAIPEEIRKHIDLRGGADRGRIFRIVPDNANWTRRKEVKLGAMSTAELVQTLEHPNGWHRDTAARLLYERQDVKGASLLEAMVRDSKNALARLHALSLLDEFKKLDQAILVTALSDSDSHVRERAIVLTEVRFKQSSLEPKLLESLARLVGDEHPRLRLQLAFTLGTLLESDSIDQAHILSTAFIALAKRDHADKWIGPAILSASPDVIAKVLFDPLLADAKMRADGSSFIGELIKIRSATDLPRGAAACIEFLAGQPTNIGWLRALGNGLQRANSSITEADRDGKFKSAFDRAAMVTSDRKADAALRLDSIDLLGLSTTEQALPALTICLNADESEDVQVRAITALAEHTSKKVTDTLLTNWSTYHPKAREALLNTFMSRSDRAKALLASIAKNDIQATDLTASQVQSLLRNKDRSVASHARKALASVIPLSRVEVTKKFQPAIGLEGDTARGQLIYQQRCVACHSPTSAGLQLGPDLVTAKNKGRDGLLTAILNPNIEVLPQYLAYIILTKEDEVFSGVVVRDEPDNVTLRMANGTDRVIARIEIFKMTTTGQSLMPEGLEFNLEVHAMADLLTYIENLGAKKNE